MWLPLLIIGQSTPSTTLNGSTTVAVLSEHDPAAWNTGSACVESAVATVHCNLGILDAYACVVVFLFVWMAYLFVDVYEKAVRAAVENGADMIVFPEGYGLTKPVFFEPYLSTVGSVPCNIADNSSSPQQYRLSCIARTNHMPIVSNIFGNYQRDVFLE